MSFDIHKHYKQLNTHEKNAVDDAFEEVRLLLADYGIKMNMADPAERVVDAIAKFILESK